MAEKASRAQREAMASTSHREWVKRQRSVSHSSRMRRYRLNLQRLQHQLLAILARDARQNNDLVEGLQMAIMRIPRLLDIVNTE